MAITVQYSPNAQLVAQAAMTAGQGDYNRFAAQQQLQRDQLQQQKDLTFFNAANDQYQQKLGILDQQYRQTQQLQASQTEQLRNIANQQWQTQYGEANANWRFAGGIANDQAMQSQRLAVGLQQQSNEIKSTEYRQQQQIAQQNLSDLRNIQAQNQRTAMSLQAERMNTLSKLQSDQQGRVFAAQQQYNMQLLDGQQRAGLMSLNSQLNQKQSMVDHANRVDMLNYSTAAQLDLSSTLADANFRRQNFLGEYSDAYDSMQQREYQSAISNLNEKRKQALNWLSETGLGNDPNIKSQIDASLMNEYMGIKNRAPIYTDSEMEFKGNVVTYKGQKYLNTANGFEALPDPTTRQQEVRMRGVNEIVSNGMTSAMKYADSVYQAKLKDVSTSIAPAGVDPAKWQAELEKQALDAYQKAYNAHLGDVINSYSNFMGYSPGDFAVGF